MRRHSPAALVASDEWGPAGRYLSDATHPARARTRCVRRIGAHRTLDVGRNEPAEVTW